MSNFNHSYSFSAVPSRVNPDASTVGAWDFAIYCEITDWLRDVSADVEHVTTILRAYESAYPAIFSEAAQNHYEYVYNL